MDTNRRGFLIGLGAIVAAPAIVRASSLMPIKVLRPEPLESWLPCYGQQLSRTRYAELFKALGTTYGTGDGFSTFNIPDLRGMAWGSGAWPPPVQQVGDVEKMICAVESAGAVPGEIHDWIRYRDADIPF